METEHRIHYKLTYFDKEGHGFTDNVPYTFEDFDTSDEDEARYHYNEMIVEGFQRVKLIKVVSYEKLILG